MEKLKNNKIINLIIEIILIVIIILLLVHSCNLQKKNDENKNKKTPTGNVDIIEIKCDNSSTCSEVTTKDETTKKNNQSTILKPINSETKEEPKEEEPLTGLVTVDNHTVQWDGKKDLKIFTNSAYELTDRISPESSNTYKFIVKNKTEYKLKYKITFLETNTQNINMLYKLKKNDAYLVNEYTTYDNINVLDQEFEPGENDTYYLDWKWFSSSNDTHIGEIQADYNLKIEIEAESMIEAEDEGNEDDQGI